MMKFDPGFVCATRLVADRMDDDEVFDDFVHRSLCRHLSGDWGDLCEDDKALNDEAVRVGDERILSAYEKDGKKIWIITESDRSTTTILFPDEY